MSQNSAQEKTEQASAHKLEQAKREGNVARSKELTTAAIIVGSGILLQIYSSWYGDHIANIFESNLLIPRQHLFDPKWLTIHLGTTLIGFIELLLPMFVGLLVFIVLSQLVPGGFVLSTKTLQFKISKINPIKGLGRMFSKQTLMELFKGILKVALIVAGLYWYASGAMHEFMQLDEMPIRMAMVKSLSLLSGLLMTLGGLLVIIALIDIPYQIWHHKNELKMTKQDIKDEHKQKEGRPEVKQRIRQVQQSMSKQRMDQVVPSADVVIVNPSHYAVAICYQPDRADAPFVVAKGVDEMAAHMKAIAQLHGVEIVSSPPLTRAIYYSTRVDQEVPGPLYVAVAQVLSYVLALKSFRQGQGRTPKPLPDFDIPNSLRR
ncbi:flagellar biosynthesis protein FlhB [Paraferrimonas sp. SM1919]|uniref:flagellar biosynthesis protein FlhB n=1 Tax=Paraferrimonas sp. SM1919 TaxID=2662263 RepID=UPI0013D30FCB|nr:flagellar biosynthesis protein FlhB [Paraferrimonas sp. SM1919]